MEDEMEAYQYNSYWETKRFLDNEELNQSWGINEACVDLGSLISPDRAESSGAVVNKTVENERNRRKKMNDSICRLRSIVPRISKMDKASTIRDAIDYVQELQEQERQLEGEIAEIQSQRASEISSSYEYNNCVNYPSLSPQTWNLPPIELLELNVKEIGDGNYIISMTCNKKNGAMSSMCEVIDYIDLKIMTSNITAVSGHIMFTLTVKAEELTSLQLREKIETGIFMINGLRRH
ncbi:basic helix-loop-helix (bHLH) DNA-binding superfamily protein [Rhynchospora pubera]|uniref:Basic helix-loop-helix (BHLH) DNA-binding superfamily protein n=1 Tax=Rhynchospora pubera TaxID=906938 RepID=A0AAV8HE11_9POAL|nr:basic helix-loop-helix (bHLH) DNA-binding superfamily protein [Rhynchospora pubera]